MDISSVSKAANQVQSDAGRSSSLENSANVQQAVQNAADDSTIERKEVEAGTGPNIGQRVDIRA